jgi:ABC-type transport system involved in multi-copper enzyme maturation permease subunit
MPAMYLSAANMGGFDELPGGVKSFYIFPSIWKYLGYLGSWMTFFCFGFLGVVLVTSEFNFRTLRQNVITGMSRTQFFLGKIYMMIAVSLFAALYYGVLGLSFGFYFTDYIMESRVMQGLDYIPRYFLMCFGYMSFAFMLGVLIRRSGIALFGYFSYVLFGELILRYFVHVQLFGRSNYMNYYPLNAMEDLVPIPLPAEMNNMMKRASEMGYDFFLSPTLAATLTTIYIALFLGIAYYVFTKRDL